MSKNTQIRLASRPVGEVQPTDWLIENNPIPTPNDGEFLIQIIYISLDPAMRGWLNDAKSYIPPVKIGDVMRAGTIGKVIESKHDGFSVGDYVHSYAGVQQYSVSNGKDVYKVDAKLAPLPAYLGTLGMPGFTAYFGLLEVGQPKEGETVLVSGAAGAVGSVVGQIAKIKGCKVVGIAGGAEKCRYLVEELGFDAAIDYKSENVYKGIKQHCPEGVDVYFDNVGGDILDMALANLRMGARIPICGAISQYNNKESVVGPKNYLSLLVNRAMMKGLVVFDYAKDYGKAGRQMGKWMHEGKLKSREDVYEGIENFHKTYQRLFTGDKMGKLVLKVGEE